MKAIALLFRDDSTDPESFSYVNLKNIKISIQGKPNQIYSRDLTSNRFYEEAHCLFSTKMKYDQNLSVFDFYKDSFACVVDLRSNEDNIVHKSGTTVMNTQSGILELSKSSASAKNHAHYICICCFR